MNIAMSRYFYNSSIIYNCLLTHYVFLVLLLLNDTKSSVSEQKVVNFYQTCIDKGEQRVYELFVELGSSNVCFKTETRNLNGYETIKTLLETFGGWPLLDDEWSDANYDRFNVIVKMNEYQIRGRLLAIAPRIGGNSRIRNFIGVKLLLKVVQLSLNSNYN